MNNVIIDLKNKTFLFKGVAYGYVKDDWVYIFTNGESYTFYKTQFRIRIALQIPYDTDVVILYSLDLWNHNNIYDPIEEAPWIKTYIASPIDIILPTERDIIKFYKLINNG